MSYQEHCPDIRLLPFIKTYWSIGGFTEKEDPEKVFPNGCMDVTFMFDNQWKICVPTFPGQRLRFLK